MRLFENIQNAFNRATNIDARETGTKKSGNATGQFGFVNTNLSATVPIDVYSPTTNTTNSYMFTDSRQISVITESPNSTLSTKKSDSVGQTTSPSQSGATIPLDVPVSLGMPSIGGGLLPTLLILGGGGFVLYQVFKKDNGAKK